MQVEPAPDGRDETINVNVAALDRLRAQRAHPNVIIEDVGAYWVPKPVAFIESLTDEERRVSVDRGNVGAHALSPTLPLQQRRGKGDLKIGRRPVGTGRVARSPRR